MAVSRTWIRRFAAMATIATFALPARADVHEIGIAKQFGVAYLQLIVMEHEHLVSKHLREAGLPDVAVNWVTLSSGASVNDALLSGAVQFVPGGPAPFLTLWSKTRGNANTEVRGLCAMNSIPHYLNTRNDAVRSVKDFTEQDRIALPAVKASNQAVLLQMAAAKAFGGDEYAKLDHLTVSMSHPDAMAALLSRAGGITSHFTAPPFQYTELSKPGIHTVLTSYQVLGGPASFNIIYATTKFHDANPRIVKAFIGALQEATDFINKDKPRAAKIYVETEHSKISAQEVLKTISDPQVNFTLVPQRVMRYAEFMHKVGTLKTVPASWHDLFFQEAAAFPGS
ncbi:MAG TPA: ABC transporter substrate-binding protein [Casimicrobiaceae bacterium]